MTSDGGKRQTHTFDAIFRRLSRAEFQDVLARAQAGELSDIDIANDVLIGWKGIQDEGGDDLPYSEAARDEVLNVWPVLPAVVAAFIEAHSAKGRAKN